MPTWSQILKEIKICSANGNSSPQDIIRRKYLNALNKYTKRSTIIYATSFTQKNGPPELTSVVEEDVQGFMEVLFALPKEPIDLILHSPGGSPEAAEGIVEYLHAQFPEIRIIVPQIAMSAATMIACSGKSILMGKHSNLGPVDPQIIVTTPNGATISPAQAIIDQFYLGLKEINEIDKQGWSILLNQYGVSLITECQNYITMSEKLVEDWLSRFMFKDLTEDESKVKAKKIAEILANHDNFKSHGRHISRDKAIEIGLVIEKLEEDSKLQDLILSVFHATTFSFMHTKAHKIIENHNGKAFIKIEN